MRRSALGLIWTAAGLGSLLAMSACSDGPEAACSGVDCEGGDREIDGGGAGGGLDARVRDGAAPEADAGDGAVLARTFLPCEVKTIVEQKCGGCHGAETRFGAPNSLASASDFQAMGNDKRVMYATVRDKINATDKTKAMPPLSSPALTAAEQTTLTAWLDQGAQGVSSTCAGSAVDGGTMLPGGDAPYDDLTCYKLLAHNGDNRSPLKVGVQLDTYLAFTYAPPWKDTSYGIVVRPVIDNAKVLHHWLLMQDNVPGIPSGGIPQIGAHPTGQLLAVWAPGAETMDLRKTGKDVGLELPANTTYTVEFHYNSSDPAAIDRSGVEVCVAKQRPKNIAAYSWLGYDNVGIPLAQWTGTCRPWTSEPITILSFMPHMHLMGRHMKGTINRANGTREVVHDKPFDFNYQVSYAVDLTMNPGDSLTTVCDYSGPAVFGQPTNLEMCYLFAMAYPKGALASPDVWGTIAHGSSSCLGQ